MFELFPPFLSKILFWSYELFITAYDKVYVFIGQEWDGMCVNTTIIINVKVLIIALKKVADQINPILFWLKKRYLFGFMISDRYS